MSGFRIAIVPPAPGGQDQGPLAAALLAHLPGAFAAPAADPSAAVSHFLAPDPQQPLPAGAAVAGLVQPLHVPAAERAALIGLARRLDLVIAATAPERDLLRAEGIEAELIPLPARPRPLLVGLAAGAGLPEAAAALPGLCWVPLAAGEEDLARRVDCLLYPGDDSGLPRLALAALAAGLPVLAPPLRWLADAPLHRFRPDDAGDLCRVLRELRDARPAAGAGLAAWAAAHEAAFRALAARGPRPRPLAPPPVRLLIHGAEAAGDVAGGPSLRVPATAAALRAAGVPAQSGSWRPGGHIPEDVVHLFNVWDPDSALAALRGLKAAGKRVVFSPIYLDFAERDFWEFDLPGLAPDTPDWPGVLARARAHAAGRGRLHEPVPGYHAMLREMVALADHVVFLSAGEREALARIGAGVEEARASILPNAVDPALWQPADPALFRAAHPDGPQDYIVTVGRIEPRKNQLMLARALDGLPLRLVAIGRAADPAYAARLRDEAGDRLIHVPRLEHGGAMLRSALAGARAFALPSWAEGAAMSALEAAAMGCPLLLGDRSSEREYFGDLAEYADPGDPAALREALLRLLGRPRPDEALRAHVLRRNGLADHAAASARIYAALAEAPPAAALPAAPAAARPGIVLDVTGLTGDPAPGDVAARLALALVRDMAAADPGLRLIARSEEAGGFRPLAPAGFLAGRGPLPEGTAAPGLSAQDTLLVLAPDAARDPAHPEALADLRAGSGCALVWLLAGAALPPQAELGWIAALADEILLPSDPAARALRAALAEGGLAAPPLSAIAPWCPVPAAAAGAAPHPALSARPFVLVPGDPGADQAPGLLARIWRGLLRGGRVPRDRMPLLVLAGRPDGCSGPALHRMARDPLLAPHLLVLGPQEAAARAWLLENCRFTLSLAGGGTGRLAVLESLAHAKPCLAPDGALPEGMTEGMAADADASAWGARIEAMLAWPELAAGMPVPGLPGPAAAVAALLRAPRARHRPAPPLPGRAIRDAAQGLWFGAGWHPPGPGNRRTAAPQSALRIDLRGLLRPGLDRLGLVLHLAAHLPDAVARRLEIRAGDLLLWSARIGAGPGAGRLRLVLELPRAAVDRDGMLPLRLEFPPAPGAGTGPMPGLEIVSAALVDPGLTNPLALLAPAEDWISGPGPAHAELADPDHRRIVAGHLAWDPGWGAGNTGGSFDLLLPVLPGAGFARMTLRGRAVATAAAPVRLTLALNGQRIAQADLSDDLPFTLDLPLDPALFDRSAPAVLAVEAVGGTGVAALPAELALGLSGRIAGAGIAAVTLWPAGTEDPA